KVKQQKEIKQEVEVTAVNGEYMTTRDVNVRSEAGLDGAIVKRLKQGTKLAVIGKTNQIDNLVWYQIEVDNQTAFVSSYYTKPYEVNVQPKADNNTQESTNDDAKGSNKEEQSKGHQYPPMSIT